MPDPARPVGTGAIVSLLLAAFVTAIGYGVVLPVLPLLLERIAGDSVDVPRQVGLLTASYAAAPLVTAPLWGRLSDRIGRRAVILIGLFGFSLTLAASAFATTLPLLYAGRVLNGFFSAAVLPAALAFVSDVAPEDRWRARRFAWIGMATILGFVIGPMLGGITSGLGGGGLGWRVVYPQSLSFLVAALLSTGILPAVWAFLPAGQPLRTSVPAPVPVDGPARLRELLVLSAAVAGGVSVFEVGIALLGREHEMQPLAIGILFAECSLVMLLAQAAAFSPLVDPALTRWFIAPGFMVMAIGLAAAPIANGFPGMLLVTGTLAASAGVTAPVLIYWISSNAGAAQGAELGRQAAAIALGQTLGSLAGGYGDSLQSLPNAAFVLGAAGLVLAAAASIGLPHRLKPA
jgi:DHA1 family multidrug resistance protein-like MFS transporter